MLWQAASPHRKKLASCASCWTNMKEAGDDHFDELVLPQRDAVFRMDSVAFPLAGNCARRLGRCGDGIVPSRIGALSAGRQHARVDATDSSGDICVLFATAFQRNGSREVIAARRGSLLYSEGQSCGEALGAAFHSYTLAGCASVAGRGLAAGRGLLQPSLCRWIFVA